MFMPKMLNFLALEKFHPTIHRFYIIFSIILNKAIKTIFFPISLFPKFRKLDFIQYGFFQKIFIPMNSPIAHIHSPKSNLLFPFETN